MAGFEEYANDIELEENRHLRAIRELRRNAMEDVELDDITRNVFGVTGSAETVARYQELAGLIGSLIGEPIIKFNLERDTLRSSEGGIISGDVFVLGRPYLEDRDIGKGSASVNLYVPVEPALAVHHWGIPEVFAGYRSRIGTDKRLAIATSANHEWENHSTDPNQDVSNTFLSDEGKLLIGREEIYKSPYLQAGLSETLLAIEQEAAKVNTQA